MENQSLAKYEAVIGLETHVQLRTKSKMFSSSLANYQSSEPNTAVDPVSLALPGTLPVVNRRAVEWAMMIGLALNCKIASVTKFDRKQYNYPDLLKGYQISQYDEPICYQGYLDLPFEPTFRVHINRVHMEEDVARLVHVDGPKGKEGYTLMDINRSGVPLMEIVTDPDLRSAEQVISYIESLQSIIRYLGVSTANMQDGSFRCDANISIRARGDSNLGTKVEVKNMNRISAVAKAVDYEIERQIKLITSGERIVQETRGWNDDKEKTVGQRSKEEANDYRYFPEPDIPPLIITQSWIDKVRNTLPELPIERKKRFIEEYDLSEYDSRLLTNSKELSDYFELVLETTDRTLNIVDLAKETANWLNGEMARFMNIASLNDPLESNISPAQLSALIKKFHAREINNNTAKIVFEEMWSSGLDPEQIIETKQLGIVSDSSSLDPVIEKVIESNPNAVNDYKDGKQTAIKFLMGQVMKSTKGQADPQVVMRLLSNELGNLK